MSLEKQISRLADAVEMLAGGGRMLFGFARVKEQSSPVTATPQFQQTTRGEILAMFQLTDSQQTTVSVAFKDKKRNLAFVDGPPEWSTDNSEVLALTPSADGLSCVVASVGPLSVATVTCKADADLGDGLKPIVGTLEIEVTAGEAQSVELNAGEPAEQQE